MAPAVEHALKSRQCIVEKKVKEMTKLAKWDEQTYYSLRETSERRQVLVPCTLPLCRRVTNVFPPSFFFAATGSCGGWWWSGGKPWH